MSAIKEIRISDDILYNADFSELKYNQVEALIIKTVYLKRTTTTKTTLWTGTRLKPERERERAATTAAIAVIEASRLCDQVEIVQKHRE